MTNAELRKLAENATPGPWEHAMSGGGPVVYSSTGNSPLASAESDADASFIAAASPDVIIALIDRCERAEAIAAAHETQPEYRRMVSWTDDVTGDVYGQTADDLTLAEAHAFTARNEVAIAIRNFFRDLRIDTLRARCEALEKERDARPAISREDARAWAYTYELDAAHVVYTALRAHAAKGGE